MHLLLTDVLTCPRCGPQAGLILLARRIEQRRVLDGVLGCPSCHEEYEISGGFADLRVALDSSAAGSAPRPAEPEHGLRLAALLGLTEPGGNVLLAGRVTAAAPGLSSAAGGTEVITDDPELAGWQEAHGVSRIATDGGGLPFYGRSLRGVALAGEAADARLEEASRVLAPLGRLVLDDAPADAAARVSAAGLQVLAQEPGALVAARLR